MKHWISARVGFRVTLLVVVTALVGACTGKPAIAPPGTAGADRFLFERGTQALKEKKWIDAHDYFTRLIDGYPQSQYRADAKLGVGDAYLSQGTAESLVLAQNEFREFLTFYPTSLRADYAQYKLGMTHFKGMRAPQRDQTETRQAVKELEAFFTRFPNSQLAGEVQARLREAKDRLGESDFEVGLHYYRSRWYPGAIGRFKELLKSDPQFTNRDGVYFYLAESLLKTENKAEALPYYERLIQEFQKSEYLEEAHKRISLLKQNADKRS